MVTLPPLVTGGLKEDVVDEIGVPFAIIAAGLCVLSGFMLELKIGVKVLSQMDAVKKVRPRNFIPRLHFILPASHKRVLISTSPTRIHRVLTSTSPTQSHLWGVVGRAGDGYVQIGVNFTCTNDDRGVWGK